MRAFLLTNPVQRYAWGSRTAIPELLGIEADGAPWAELWMGAHPRAPSRIEISGVARSLADVVEENPEPFLGPRHAASGTLPFLFKVLAAAAPLSIQCHPDAEQARAGFDREEALGVPRGAAHRLYPDPTAKPELVVARSTFVGMKGFRVVDETQALLTAYGLERLLPEPGLPPDVATRATFSRLLQSPPEDRRRWVKIAVERAEHQPGPEAEWVARLSVLFPSDSGALAPLLLNLVHLAPGDALFLRARELHAYLQGTAFEVMANSDNVLRGGLTQKHIDVHELLRVLDFEPRSPEPISPVEDRGGWKKYPTAAWQFSLRVGRPKGTALVRDAMDCLEIAMCAAGTVQIRAGEDEPLVLATGQSAAIPASVGGYTVDGDGEVYVASAGDAAAAVPVGATHNGV